MLEYGMMATVNSDDPAYFGGYLNENYLEVAKALSLTREQIVRLAKNSFTASFLDQDVKQKMIEKIDRFNLEYIR
jgi:adenosine deaminase